MTFLLFLLSSLSLIASSTSIEFFIDAKPEGPDYIWKTDITLTCYWDPTKAGNSAEFLIDNTSIYRDNSPYVVSEEDTSKVEVSTDMDAGQAQLIIKDLTAADTHEIKCSVSWLGLSPAQEVTVNEPPTTPVSGIAASAVDFATATISFDAVEDATKYTVGWQAAGAADWEEVEITDVTYGLTGLLVATTYTVRVRAGDLAGYRDDVELATTSFTTLDNRPPVPVDAISVSDAEYNATVITITWNTDTNTASGLVVSSITAKVSQDDVEVEGSLQTLSGDETSATFDLPGPGTYIFVVSTHNDFSAEGDTASVIEHIVEETKIPTTSPPTEPKPVTEEKTNEVEAGPGGGEHLKCTDPQLVNDYETSPVVLESTPGNTQVIVCYLSESSTFTSDNIVWAYDGASQFNQTQLTDQEAFSITNEDDKSNFAISSVGDNHAGEYTCTVAGETCRFQLTVTGMSTGGNGAASMAFSGLLALAVLLRLL